MTMCALNKVKGMKFIMKNEYFNIGDADYLYDNIDRLNAKDLENLNGDNLFLAFLKENNQTTLSCLSAIDGRIYNFNTHKFINDNSEILFARAFSDIMPNSIWRLVYIVSHDIITVDIDDYKSYLVEEFEEFYKGKIEEGTKERILKNGYITHKFKKINYLNQKNLKDINGTNIFLAILENINIQVSNGYQKNQNLIDITYEGINTSAKILESMIDSEELKLPDSITKVEFINNFKKMAKKDLDAYWNTEIKKDAITANFIASINGHIYNFCTNEYLDPKKIKINYAEALNEILPENKWKLSYQNSGRIACITIDESAIDTLTHFQSVHFSEIDKKAKTKVLRNGYKIQS